MWQAHRDHWYLYAIVNSILNSEIKDSSSFLSSFVLENSDVSQTE
jgi:hypothetical protein